MNRTAAGRVARAALILGVCLVWSGCNSSTTSKTARVEEPVAAVPEAAAPKAEIELEWTECTLDSFADPDDDPVMAECATAELPLRRDVETDLTTPVFVKRVRKDGAKNQVWILEGGPGGGTEPGDMRGAIEDAWANAGRA